MFALPSGITPGRYRLMKCAIMHCNNFTSYVVMFDLVVDIQASRKVSAAALIKRAFQRVLAPVARQARRARSY